MKEINCLINIQMGLMLFSVCPLTWYNSTCYDIIIVIRVFVQYNKRAWMLFINLGTKYLTAT